MKELSLIEDFVSNPDEYVLIETDYVHTVGNLSRVPLIAEPGFEKGLKYITAKTAMNEGKLIIPESENVPELEVENQADSTVFIPNGTVLVSGKKGWQDRMATADVLIPEGKSVKIPVSCVERNRWGRGRSDNQVFTYLGMKTAGKMEESGSDFGVSFLATPGLRYSAQATSIRSLRTGRGPRADQGEIWREVEKEVEQADADTSTKTLSEVFVKDKEKGEFDIYENEIGSIFLGGDSVIGMEFFDRPEIWEELSEDVIKGYKIDSRRMEGEYSQESLNKFLKDLSKVKLESFDAIGLGVDVRLDDGIKGSSLVAEKTPIHFAAFSKPKEYKPGNTVRRPRRRERNPVIFPTIFRDDPIVVGKNFHTSYRW